MQRGEEEEEDILAPPRFCDKNYSPYSTRSIEDAPPKSSNIPPPDIDEDHDDSLVCNAWMTADFDPDESNRSEAAPAPEKFGVLPTVGEDGDSSRQYERRSSIGPPVWLTQSFAHTTRNPVKEKTCLERFCSFFK